MCLTTAIYCVLLAVNTHIENVLYSNTLLGMTWAFAFLAYFFYLRSLEAYFEKRIWQLSFLKVYCILYAVTQTICNATYLMSDYNFLFNISPIAGESLFYRAMKVTISPNIIGQTMGVIGGILVVYTSAIIWLYINKQKRKEAF